MTLSGDRSGDWLAKALQRSGIGRPAAQRGHGRPTLCQTGSGVVPALPFPPFPFFFSRLLLREVGDLSRQTGTERARHRIVFVHDGPGQDRKKAARFRGGEIQMPARTELRGHGVRLIDRADRYGDFVTVHVFRFENGLLTVRQVNRAQPALIRLVGRRVQHELTGSSAVSAST